MALFFLLHRRPVCTAQAALASYIERASSVLVVAVDLADEVAANFALCRAVDETLASRVGAC